jgi:hypothetical protein
MDRSELKTSLIAHGQEHVLRFTESLRGDELTELYTELSELDLNKVAKCWDEAQKTLSEASEKKDEHLEPLDRSIVGSTTRDKSSVPRWEDLGQRICFNYHIISNLLLLACACALMLLVLMLSSPCARGSTTV